MTASRCRKFAWQGRLTWHEGRKEVGIVLIKDIEEARK